MNRNKRLGRTRSGRLRVSNDERRAWQRAARRSYSHKDSGSNEYAVNIAKRLGNYGQTPESRYLKTLTAKRPAPPSPPTCPQCNSKVAPVEHPYTRQKYTPVLCGSCQSDVKSALKQAAKS